MRQIGALGTTIELEPRMKIPALCPDEGPKRLIHVLPIHRHNPPSRPTGIWINAEQGLDGYSDAELANRVAENAGL